MEALFANAAEGMYSLITDPEKVSERHRISVEVEGLSAEGLLVAWLNELIFRFDARDFIGKQVETVEITPPLPATEGMGERPFRLTAIVAGESFDPERHERRLLLKAATYHLLKIENGGGVLTAEVIFDI